MHWILDLDILLLDIRYCKKTWSPAKTKFWGALNTSPPPKKIHFLPKNKEFLLKESLGLLKIGNYKKMFIIMQNYEFSQPPRSYVETCTSFYVFSGLRWLIGWVGYWTPTQPHHRLSAFYHPTPSPRHHYLQHTIGNDTVPWFGAIFLVR